MHEAYLEAHPIGDYTVDETTADSDDEMESWGDVHEEGGAPAEDGGERVNLFFHLLCISERRALPGAPFFSAARARRVSLARQRQSSIL